ncbi:DUF1772 domain-containing protein [Streptomyces solincola]|uniref:DUF1772 domain-containing protein n=2 Tax=Streptomyces solincola TaxID=2100817 RepID=A0A2S9Q1H6_9ACTN|nr:DUF1772 domain-containing protein [Streptomyces sp. ODS05-4]PRH80506.1 DUF1772 domain-containing protein [Streptomyces solincola]
MTADQYRPGSYPHSHHSPGGHPLPVPPPPAAPPARTSGAAGWLLVVSAAMMGLLSGLFFAFDVSVMPGLARLDDVDYLRAMQSFNDLIDNNGLFGMLFMAALAAPVWAAIVEYRRGRRRVAVWTAVAAALYLVTVLITVTVNIPLNTELAGLGDPAKAGDLSLVDDFKNIWEPANIVRTVLCTAAVVCVAQALKLHGRSTPRPPAAPVSYR